MSRRKLRNMLTEILWRRREWWRYLAEREKRRREQEAFWASPAGSALWKAVMEA